MAQTFTTATKTSTESTQHECAMEGLSEDDEQLYASMQPAFNKLIKLPKTETIEAILKHSKSL